MPKYITDTFARMDLQQIREFLLSGMATPVIETEIYDTRLVQGSEPVFKRLKSIYSNPVELDSASAEILNALSVRDDVYMEIGMKAGARLVYQLLLTDDSLPLAERNTAQM